MTMKKTNIRHKPAKVSSGPNVPLLLVRTFGCGVGAALLLLALMAFVFEKTALPLHLIKPCACAAAGIGAAISGAVLAAGLGRQRLACGLGCGIFYALCLLLASYFTAGTIAMTGANSTVLIALLVGGVLGGAIPALHAQGSAPVR